MHLSADATKVALAAITLAGTAPLLEETTYTAAIAKRLLHRNP